MNSEPNPNAQMPAGKARHAAGVWFLEDCGLFEMCIRTLHPQNDCRAATHWHEPMPDVAAQRPLATADQPVVSLGMSGLRAQFQKSRRARHSQENRQYGCSFPEYGYFHCSIRLIDAVFVGVRQHAICMLRSRSLAWAPARRAGTRSMTSTPGLNRSI